MESATFTMYHGGNDWKSQPEVRPSKKGRHEAGVGIYLCTTHRTAAKYSRGSNVITVCEIDRNYRDASQVSINLDDAIEFLRNARVKNKKLIISDLKRNCERQNRDTFTASILNNLVVNHEAGSGKSGLAIVNFMLSQGVDASHERQSMEDWLVVFNPKIIKSYRRLDNKEEIVWDLPRINPQKPSSSESPSSHES